MCDTFSKVCFVVLFRTLLAGEKIAMGGLALNILKKENGLKLEETNYIVGRTLNFDSKTEKIIGDDQANEMLSRTYRPPYMVPEKV